MGGRQDTTEYTVCFKLFFLGENLLYEKMHISADGLLEHDSGFAPIKWIDSQQTQI